MNAIVAFLLIAAAVYFFVVLPMNAVVARQRRGEIPPDPTTKKCMECLSDVPIAARRCAFVAPCSRSWSGLLHDDELIDDARDALGAAGDRRRPRLRRTQSTVPLNVTT